ncbi:MAG TPA: hypothetical protein VEG61_04770 [Candidatus Dormibacteraeota bacterium]|nr:hypothetical protein [Candidatus Dormibacteraeota bacterium]
MSFLLAAYEYAKYGGDFHPIGRWKGEGSGFVADTIRRHQAEQYWSSYAPPAYATPTMYASSPHYSPYAYGGGYPAYGYGGYPQLNGYYGRTYLYPQCTYPLTYGYWRPVIPTWGY